MVAKSSLKSNGLGDENKKCESVLESLDSGKLYQLQIVAESLNSS